MKTWGRFEDWFFGSIVVILLFLGGVFLIWGFSECIMSLTDSSEEIDQVIERK